jgi:deoxycytidine triphosphate deaminase
MPVVHAGPAGKELIVAISNTKILHELGRNIFIAPLPKLEDFDNTGFNLHLGAPLLVWPEDVEYVVDHRKEHIAKAWERHGIAHDLSKGSFTLRRNQKCLGFTQEHIKLPIANPNPLMRLASHLSPRPIAGTRSYLGRLSNRSWAGRAFIRSAVDAFEIKPGTNNYVTLEIISDFDFELYEGMPFIQIGFEAVDGPIFATNGWVHGQTTPSGGQTPRKADFTDEILAIYEAASRRPTR